MLAQLYYFPPIGRPRVCRFVVRRTRRTVVATRKRRNSTHGCVPARYGSPRAIRRTATSPFLFASRAARGNRTDLFFGDRYRERDEPGQVIPRRYGQFKRCLLISCSRVECQIVEISSVPVRSRPRTNSRDRKAATELSVSYRIDERLFHCSNGEEEREQRVTTIMNTNTYKNRKKIGYRTPDEVCQSARLLYSWQAELGKAQIRVLHLSG